MAYIYFAVKEKTIGFVFCLIPGLNLWLSLCTHDLLYMLACIVAMMHAIANLNCN